MQKTALPIYIKFFHKEHEHRKFRLYKPHSTFGNKKIYSLNKNNLDAEGKNIEYCQKVLHDSNITVNVTINNQGNIQVNSQK